MIVAFGVACLVMAFSFWETSQLEGYAPWLWPTWFGAAGLSCFVFAYRIQSSAWWQISRIMVVIALLSRVGGIIGRYEDGKLPSAWQLPGGIALYLLAAGSLSRLWALDFRYWSRRAAGQGPEPRA